MKEIIIFLITISISLLLTFHPAFPQDKKPLQFKKQPEIQQIKPKKPVKIKLKRSGDGKYSWDISGDNADDIVRADRRLIQLLKIE